MNQTYHEFQYHLLQFCHISSILVRLAPPVNVCVFSMVAHPRTGFYIVQYRTIFQMFLLDLTLCLIKEFRWQAILYPSIIR
jgi:hypothetical protein